MDAGAGQIGAVQMADDGLSLLWTADQTTLSFLTLIGDESQRVLIGMDIPVRSFRQLQSYSTEAGGARPEPRHGELTSQAT